MPAPVPPLLALLAAACRPPEDTGGIQPFWPTDTAPEPEDSVGVEQVPGAAGASDVFTLDRVLEASITLSDESWAALSANPFEYVPATLVFDGVALDPVGVRIKGRLGSYRDLSGKSGFKIDLNRYDAGRQVGDLEKLNFNNMVQDGAKVHELTAYHVWRLAGVPAPRVGYVWLTVNGEAFGLYTNVEVMDDVFLDANYTDPSGSLYDGDYVLSPHWSYTLLDLDDASIPLFQQDEGADVGKADLQALVDAIDDTAGTAGFDAALGAVADLDEFAAMWAGEAWTGHYDSYSFNRNNYRIYFDPESGLADFFPWDPDWAFYDATPVTSASGRLAYWCRADAACHQRLLVALDRLMETIAVTDLEGEVDAAAALIRPWLSQDPRLETDLGTIGWYQDHLRTWIRSRSDRLRATSGL